MGRAITVGTDWLSPRLLLEKGHEVYPFTVHAQGGGSEGFTINQELLLKQCNLPNIEHSDDIPSIPEESIVIDGLFGSGLSRKIEGIFALVVQAINDSAAIVVAIDAPSGLYVDRATEKEAVTVTADYTYTFQSPKLAFLLPQNEQYVGAVGSAGHRAGSTIFGRGRNGFLLHDS